MGNLSQYNPIPQLCLRSTVYKPSQNVLILKRQLVFHI
uniref:Uncharacterized protein n=1 Tax=Anguilla anguilla TaxID=7936 RepID=A0A0E9S5R5_ANGAN